MTTNSRSATWAANIFSALKTVFFPISNFEIIAAMDTSSNKPCPSFIYWSWNPFAGFIVARSTKSNAVTWCISKIRMFRIRKLMMNLKHYFYSVSIFSPTILTSIAVSVKTFFHKSQIFRSLIFLLTFGGVPSFPIWMCASRQMTNWRFYFKPFHSCAQEHFSFRWHLPSSQSLGYRNICLQSCLWRHQPCLSVVLFRKFGQFFLNIRVFRRVSVGAIKIRISTFYRAKHSFHRKVSFKINPALFAI